MLKASSFVLQRRINVSYDAVNEAFAERDVRVRVEHAINDSGLVRVARFMPAFAATGAEREWVGTARVAGAPTFEIELSSWDGNVEIRVRPMTNRTSGWSGRKVNRYFEAAHAAADLMARMTQGLAVAREQFHPERTELATAAA
jgi:hypothetical protein